MIRRRLRGSCGEGPGSRRATPLWGLAVLALWLGGFGGLGPFGGPTPAAAQVDFDLLSSVRDQIARLSTAPGASRSAEAGFVNPAAWAIQKRGSLYLALEDYDGDAGPDDFQGALAVGPIGFGLRRLSQNGADWYDYTFGLGFGTKSQMVSTSYSFVRGAEDVFGSSERLSSGWIFRKDWGSLGLTHIHDYADGDDLAQADVGFRPFGPRWTFFGDMLTAEGDGKIFDDVELGFGVEAHVLPGLSLSARGDDEGFFGFRVNLGFDTFRPSVGQRYDDDSNAISTTYAVEFTEGPSLSELFDRAKRRPEVPLRGTMTYRRYQWFDERPRFLAVLNQVNAQADDPKVDVLVLNLSSVRMSAAQMWELRAQLAGARARGKRVAIYFDRVGLPGYALASVADELWMDPQGDLDLRGIALGRSYYKAGLEKLGVGVEEWRYFTYKSAMEGFARTGPSEADVEQREAILDDFYEEAVNLVVHARGLQRSEWDRIVDQQGSLIAYEAEELGLVDAVGDFHDMREALDEVRARPGEDAFAEALGPVLGDRVWRGEEWGEAPQIAVLYAIGPCEMDGGIRGRALSKLIRQVRENPRVKAVVFRADSPGGDPLPSDLVARELKATAEVKPVIVSQGQVAGSGGYWISMFGDEILASPYTITGSIGVIAGHVWDEGIAEKAGIDYAQQKRGRSSDLFQGPTFPIFGVQIPHRPATPEEKARAERLIRELYRGFTEAVAEGRGMTPEAVDRVGQGRIWSGRDGLDIGLVDEIGGLWRAILRAKEAAGLAPDARVELLEGPGLGPFDLSGLRPSLVGARLARWWSGEGAIVGTGYVPTEASEALPMVEGAQIPRLDRLHLQNLILNPGRPAVLMESIDLGEMWPEVEGGDGLD